MDGRSFHPRAALLSMCVLAMWLCAPAVYACVGDCNGDGQVTVNELIIGVNIALGNTEISACPSFDRNQDGEVTVDEILSGVIAALNGCPALPSPTASRSATPTLNATATPMPSASPTATPVATASATPTDTLAPTPTDTPDAPPVLPPTFIYRTYPGYAIALPIGASEADGDPLTYSANALPDGAQLDAVSGIFSWTPQTDQLGPFYVPVTVTDTDTPPQSVQGQLVFKVSPSDPCVVPSCDPATGCQSTLVSPAPACCPGVALTRVAEPVTDCPAGRVVFAGRNVVGFGKLQDCDYLPVVNFGQTGGSVRFNLETRCMRTADAPVTVHARLDSSSSTHPTVIDDSAVVNLQPGTNGYAQQLQKGAQFPVKGSGPFFDLEGAEANFTVTVTDFDNVSVTESVRVILTFQTEPDLPETP